MRAVELIARSLNMANARMTLVAQAVRPEEWTARAVPDTNLPAYTLWHCVRATDATVNFSIRGVPEVSQRDPWRGDPVIDYPGVGVGHTREEADELGRRVAIDRVLQYAADLRADASAWLKTVDDDYLATIPDYAARRAASPVYGSAAGIAATRDLEGQPVWRFLMITCYAHVWSHLDEILLLVQAGRASALSQSRG